MAATVMTTSSYLSTRMSEMDWSGSTCQGVQGLGTFSHPFWKGCNSAHFCSNRRKDAKLRLNLGPKLRTAGDAEDRSSSVRRSLKCAATTGRRVLIEDYGYDLYELLGVERDATIKDIKNAYRWLQKRCHPDIAGPAGHDMAILLNDAYSVLSDIDQRADYDATCAERAQFEGYTGEPLFSKWYGAPGEDRAVFVEESRCIGCLKCALIAPDTFAIESRYGRARAVGQWANDEGTIKDAIRACPVDCISWVEKVKLPALEFIMSKQPRLPVGIDNYSYVGVRMENVFEGAEKFLNKCAKREERRNSCHEETAAQREARMAAATAIHTRAGRWWHDLMGNKVFSGTGAFSNLWDPISMRTAQGALIPLKSIRVAGVAHNQFDDKNGPDTFSFIKDEDLDRLLEAAKQKRRGGTKSNAKLQNKQATDEEYWTPMEPISCPLPQYTPRPAGSSTPQSSPQRWAQWQRSSNLGTNPEDYIHGSVMKIISGMPIIVSVTAAILVGMGGESGVARSETDLVSGPLPATVTSGVVMHMFLAAAVWYMIAAGLCAAVVSMSVLFISARDNK